MMKHVYLIFLAKIKYGGIGKWRYIVKKWRYAYLGDFRG